MPFWKREEPQTEMKENADNLSKRFTNFMLKGGNATSFQKVLVKRATKTTNMFGKAGKNPVRTGRAQFDNTVVVSNPLEAYTSCRLIPLDKNPGVKPIGIGEIIRRIIEKAIQIVKSDVVESAGSLQLCAGQPGGSEAAVHAANKISEEQMLYSSWMQPMHSTHSIERQCFITSSTPVLH